MNSEPWNINISDRYKKVIEKGFKKVILYIYERADTSTFRYRVYNMCQTLEYSNEWLGSYFFEDELHLLDDLLNQVDCVIFSRVRWSFKQQDFLYKLKNKNIPVGFDVDDLVFDLAKIPLLMKTLEVIPTEENYSYYCSYVSRLHTMGSLCDFHIGTNHYISSQLEKVFKKPSYQIQNFLNHEQIKISDELFDKKEISSFKIGYFSGTPTHNKDFKVLADEMDEFLTTHKDATLEVVGFIDFPACMQKHLQAKRVFHTPLVNFLELQKKIAAVDLNIVPLVNNEFTNCKSELKFFESAIVGTLTAATPTYTFASSIEQAKTGFLCEEGYWLNTLKQIYKNEISPSIKDKARKYCLDRYSPASQTKTLENILNSIISLV